MNKKIFSNNDVLMFVSFSILNLFYSNSVTADPIYNFCLFETGVCNYLLTEVKFRMYLKYKTTVYTIKDCDISKLFINDILS